MTPARFDVLRSGCRLAAPLTHASAIGALLLTLVPLVGCQSVKERTTSVAQSTKNLLTWEKSEAEQLNERPQRMVAIWSESVEYSAQRKPTRGLGGRIYFYNHKHQPIEADGELLVYAYSDSDENEEKVAPDRKYVINAERFADYYSPSEFGPSYSIWIPWDEVGNESESISLVPIFKPKDGAPVVGDHSRNLLPGRESSPAELAKRVRPSAEEEPAVQQASFDGKTSWPESTDQDETQLRTSTIRVPSSMRQRLLAAESMRHSTTQRGSQQITDGSDVTTQLPPGSNQLTRAELLTLLGPQAADTVTRDETARVEATPPATRSPIRREPFRPQAPTWRVEERLPGQTQWQRGRATWRSPDQL